MLKQVQHDVMINVDSRKASEGREAQRANSRGFSNPWNNDMKKKWRLQRRGRAVRVAVPRLPDATIM